MVQRLKINKTTKEDFEYLIDYQYIKEPTLTAIEIFLKEHCII